MPKPKNRQRPRPSKPGSPHGSGLGVFRWVVERTLAWLHRFRHLALRYERRADVRTIQRLTIEQTSLEVIETRLQRSEALGGMNLRYKRRAPARHGAENNGKEAHMYNS
jgi:hypothetical protein